MSPTQTNPIRVFIIEDYALVRVGLIALLQSDSQVAFVGEADNAKDGIAQIQALRPDVVLMDLGLPHMNGIEATRALKAFDKEIKVIILTSHEDQAEVMAALSAEANAYCIKDIEAKRLLEVIKTVHEGATWLDPAIAGIAMALLTQPNLDANSEPRHFEPTLSERELKILHYLVEGKNNAEIAQEIFVSIHTVKGDVSHILQKLAVHDRVQAAVKAVQEGIV